MRSELTKAPRLVVALDFPSPQAALSLANQLDPARCRVKVGKELFCRGGPAIVEHLAGRGFAVFVDLKFHDIPNTVAGACRALADSGAWMLNVHALGGSAMVAAAREALEGVSRRPLLTAVTVLTSHDQDTLAEVGIQGSPDEAVSRLAGVAARGGADGVVCSAREAAMLRDERGGDFVLVTPGIRPAGGDSGDQKRTMTPADAIEAGADYLVVGRPITKAPDPLAALVALQAEIPTA
ncbi:orotidine-5'-phosphate decarboxylase [Ectothiorhodospiraceae bacterium WFHF3C12]|nr:orotidine-5'-phosphate decarboxylase [Ectothiorhodospiraceae bacterium WFHF3C12]